jgi:hypothetical protein
MHQLKEHLTFILLAFLTWSSLTSFRNPGFAAQDPELFTPLNFYVAEIQDQRDIKGPETIGLKNFIAENLPKDLSRKPIVIAIKELSVTETPGRTGLMEGVIKINLSFSLKKETYHQHLLNYTGGMRYSRLATNKAIIEQHLKTLNKSSMLYFNKWINTNITSSKVLASGVKVHFKYYKEELEGDTIYYAASRPLTWSDFKSKTRRSNKYAAMVMPNIGYDQNEEISNGVIHVTITLKTFLAKTDCWLGSSYKDSYMLNHEQRHFDVAKIVTEQFSKQIAQAKLNPDNYEAVINMQYLDSYRDMNKLQKDYDVQTAHGLNRMAQETWNKRIDDLLAGKLLPDA